MLVVRDEDGKIKTDIKFERTKKGIIETKDELKRLESKSK